MNKNTLNYRPDGSVVADDLSGTTDIPWMKNWASWSRYSTQATTCRPDIVISTSSQHHNTTPADTFRKTNQCSQVMNLRGQPKPKSTGCNCPNFFNTVYSQAQTIPAAATKFSRMTPLGPDNRYICQLHPNPRQAETPTCPTISHQWYRCSNFLSCSTTVSNMTYEPHVFQELITAPPPKGQAHHKPNFCNIS